MLLSLSQFALGTYHSEDSHDCFSKLDMISLRIVVGVTCGLSMIGSVLIILSYFLIPDIRTKAREMLVNLSLMDFVAAAANCTGIAINFGSVLGTDNVNITHNSSYYVRMNHLCLAQAVFAQYGTLSSVLWTICLAVYIYLCITIGSQKVAYRSVIFFYVLCYGIPLMYTAWYVRTGKLGFDHVGGSGWCTVKTSENGVFNVVFGNDIWIYTTMFLVTVIFLSLHFHLKREMQRNRTILAQNWKKSMEMKLLFIPIFFILLRIWSLIFTVLVVEAKVQLPCTASLFFIFMGGIGDSGQGFANGILYVLFTHKVRTFFLHLILCRKGCGQGTVFKRKTFYGSFSSVQRKEFSDDYVSDEYSGDSTNVGHTKDPKSLLLNT